MPKHANRRKVTAPPRKPTAIIIQDGEPIERIREMGGWIKDEIERLTKANETIGKNDELTFDAAVGFVTGYPGMLAWIGREWKFDLERGEIKYNLDEAHQLSTTLLAREAAMARINSTSLYISFDLCRRLVNEEYDHLAVEAIDTWPGLLTEKRRRALLYFEQKYISLADATMARLSDHLESKKRESQPAVPLGLDGEAERVPVNPPAKKARRFTGRESELFEMLNGKQKLTSEIGRDMGGISSDQVRGIIRSILLKKPDAIKSLGQIRWRPDAPPVRKA